MEHRDAAIYVFSVFSLHRQVVTKLFNIVQPDVALFGRKDYQQWRLLQRMVRDLDVPVKVVGMPICR